jgi:DNA-binding response OmpR family regulator
MEPQPNQQRILLVEDIDDQAWLTMQFLLRSGHDVRRVADATSAISILENERIDLLVLDLMLPVRPGIDVLRYLDARQKRRRPKVLVTTAAFGWAEILRSNGYSIDAYVDKLSGHAALVREVGTLLHEEHHA